MKITIMSQDNAIEYAKYTNKKIAIISIVGENESPIDFIGDNIVNIFRMFFEDIERPIGKYKAPDRKDFIGLKEFLDNNIDNIEEIVVHCHAGISRSSGCASAIARYIGVDDNFIWNSYKYVPNRLVFKCALEELEIDLSNDTIQDLYSINDEAHMINLEAFEDVNSLFE